MPWCPGVVDLSGQLSVAGGFFVHMYVFVCEAGLSVIGLQWSSTPVAA